MRTPTIQVRLHEPLWLRLLRRAAVVGGVLLLCAATFRIGQHYPLTATAEAPQPAPAAPVAEAAVPQNKPVAANAASPATAPGPSLPTAPSADQATTPGLDAAAQETNRDGLELKGARLSLDPANGEQLRYRLTLANIGRRFNGSLRFTFTGEREGKAEQWRYPANGAMPDPKLQVEVSRFLKTEGVIALPSGFVPRAATVDLLEPEGVRLSKQTRIGRPS